jgi:hypothetical protein
MTLIVPSTGDRNELQFIDVVVLKGKHKIDVACGNTAVRLVSSGRHDNSVTLAFDLLLDIVSPALVCPAMLEVLTCEYLTRQWNVMLYIYKALFIYKLYIYTVYIYIYI